MNKKEERIDTSLIQYFDKVIRETRAECPTKQIIQEFNVQKAEDLRRIVYKMDEFPKHVRDKIDGVDPVLIMMEKYDL